LLLHFAVGWIFWIEGKKDSHSKRLSKHGNREYIQVLRMEKQSNISDCRMPGDRAGIIMLEASSLHARNSDRRSY